MRNKEEKGFWTTNSISYKHFFLHNSHGTSESPDCGNLEGADLVGNLRWGDTELSMHFRKANMETSMHFSKVNTEHSMHFRKANIKLSMHFRMTIQNTCLAKC